MVRSDVSRRELRSIGHDNEVEEYLKRRTRHSSNGRPRMMVRAARLLIAGEFRRMIDVVCIGVVGVGEGKTYCSSVMIFVMAIFCASSQPKPVVLQRRLKSAGQVRDAMVSTRPGRNHILMIGVL